MYLKKGKHVWHRWADMMRKQAYHFKSNSPVGSNKIKEPQPFVNLLSYIRYKNSNVLLSHWANTNTFIHIA